MKKRSVLATGLAAVMLVAAVGSLPASAHSKKHKKRPPVPTTVTSTSLPDAGPGSTPTTQPPPAPVLTLDPMSAFQNGIDGDTGVTVLGRGFARNISVTLRVSSFFTSPCNGSAAFVSYSGGQLVSGSPLTLTSDSQGVFNALLVRSGCRSGTYEVTAGPAEGAPAAKASFTVIPPQSSPTEFSLAPGSVRRTDSGVIATTLRISGLYEQEQLEIASPDLARCGAARLVQENRSPAPIPARIFTDFGGNNILGLVASGCPAGQYVIKVTEVAAAGRTLSAILEVTA